MLYVIQGPPHLKTCQELITILDYCTAEDPKGTKGEASEEGEGRKLEKWLETHSRVDSTLQVSKRWLQEQQRKKSEGEKMTEKRLSRIFARMKMTSDEAPIRELCTGDGCMPASLKIR